MSSYPRCARYDIRDSPAPTSWAVTCTADPQDRSSLDRVPPALAIDDLLTTSRGEPPFTGNWARSGGSGVLSTAQTAEDGTGSGWMPARGVERACSGAAR